MSPSATDEAFLARLTDYLNEWGEFATEQDDFTATSDPFLLLDTEHTDDISNISESSAITTKSTEQNVVDQRQAHKKADAAKRKLKYANKVKNETKLLREQVRHLSAELNELQKSKKKIKVLDEKFAELPVWMAVALRQEQGRREAEEQQQRLLSAVVNRDKFIRGTEKEVKEKLDESRDLPTLDDIPADITLFEEYLQDMDEMYSQTDAVFYPFDLEESPLVPYREGPNWRSIGGLQYAEFLDILPISFTFEQTCTVMWKSILQTHGKEGRMRYTGVSDSDNTLAVSFRLVCQKESSEPVTFHVHFVTRRYVEPKRVVIVWKALTEGEGRFVGFHSDETGWSVVRSNDSDNAAMMPTVMQTFVRYMPTHVRGKSWKEKDLENFATLVMESGEEDGLEAARLMESLMIDDVKLR